MGRSRTLGASLGWLLVAALLPLVAAGAALLRQQWSQQRELATEHLRGHARALQRAVDRELALDLAVLGALASSRDIDARHWESFHASATEAAGVRPGSWIVLYTPSGQNVVNTSVAYGTPLPNFRTLARDVPEADWNGRKLPLPGAFLYEPFATGRPSFSGLFFGPVNGGPVVASVVPVMRGGKPRYGLAVAYGSDFFVRLLESQRVPEGLVTALLDGDGRFIARNVAPDRFVARHAPAPFTHGAASLPRDGVGEGTGLDSTRFVYAYSHSDATDWMCVVALPGSALLAPAWRAVGVWLAVLSVAGLVAFVAAARLWRRVAIPLRALADQARSLGEQRREVPATEIDEVDALRVALRDAARSAEAQRETEREREEAREHLRASEEKFRSVFEQAALGIGRVRFDDARWIDVNEAFCRMLGYGHDQLLATAWPDITHPDDVEADLVPFRRMAAGDLDSYTVEKRFRHRDGHWVWAKLTLSVVRDAQHRPDYEIAIIEDVTDRKTAEAALRAANEKLRDADRRKDEFLSMLSHELRNPLAPIRSSVYILQRAEPASAQALRARNVIERQAEHLTRLVDDLLDVTRIASGKILLHRERVDLRELVAQVAEDMHLAIEKRGVRFETALPPERMWADADATRVTQVLGNLLHNAAKFTHQGDTISVTLREVDAAAEILVRDTGAGIDPEILPTLFDAFVQGERTLARSEGGLGLGLALVRGLVELHGGSVRAQSDGPGRGATFVVTLPLTGPLVTERAYHHGGVRRGATRHHVLVVDDNADAAESLAQLVELFGHRVEIAYDGPSAVEKARATRPDVVLCDIGLPGMTGYEVAQALRAAHDGSVRLVAISGYAQPEDVRRAAEAGFDAHIAKPADPDKIERILG